MDRFSAALKYMPIPAAILKPIKNNKGNIDDFTYIFINDAGLASLQLKEEQLIDQKFLELFPVSRTNGVLTACKKVLSKGGTEELNSLDFNHESTKLQGDFRVHVINLHEYILINWVDISFYMKQIKELQSSNFNLKKAADEYSVELEETKESKEFYRIMGESIPYGVWMTDSQGKILHISPSFLNLFNTDFETVIKNGWVSLLPHDAKTEVENLWNDSLITGNKFTIEYEVTGNDGKQHLVLSIAEPIKQNGKIQQWVGLHLNNDEQKEHNEKLNELISKLKTSNEELEQFAYIASHDLQEPLRMITSFTQLIENKYKDSMDKDTAEFIHYIVDGAKRMKNLIDDLLSYSRVISRKKPFVRIDINTIVNNIISNLKLLIEETQAEIIFNDLPVVYADRTQIIQVFQNLISNAIKFKGNKMPVIIISAEEKNDEWLFAVKDNGIGIDEKYFNKIFTIFQKLHTRDKYPGTGIGLAITKRIIERFGGHIFVESKPGEGSTFYFTIPKRSNDDFKI